MPQGYLEGSRGARAGAVRDGVKGRVGEGRGEGQGQGRVAAGGRGGVGNKGAVHNEGEEGVAGNVQGEQG